MSRSPHDVKFQDLIDQAVNRLQWMEKTYPGMKATNQISDWTATHNIACQKTLIRILKKYKRDPQTDLFEQVEPIKKQS